MGKNARSAVSSAPEASPFRRRVWPGAGWTALGFGVLTVLAGWSVLAGVRDPGRAVLLPFLAPAVPATGDSLASMSLRTGVWLAITAALIWSFPAREV